MRIDHEDVGGGVVRASLTGSLDIAGAAEADPALAAIAAGAERVALDMSGVEFLASVGVRSLMKAARALSAKGGRLVVFGADDAARKVLRSTGVDQVIAVVEDEAAALAALG